MRCASPFIAPRFNRSTESAKLLGLRISQTLPQPMSRDKRHRSRTLRSIITALRRRTEPAHCSAPDPRWPQLVHYAMQILTRISRRYSLSPQCAIGPTVCSPSGDCLNHPSQAQVRACELRGSFDAVPKIKIMSSPRTVLCFNGSFFFSISSTVIGI
jgi:hypothetical protein